LVAAVAAAVLMMMMSSWCLFELLPKPVLSWFISYLQEASLSTAQIIEWWTMRDETRHIFLGEAEKGWEKGVKGYCRLLFRDSPTSRQITERFNWNLSVPLRAEFTQCGLHMTKFERTIRWLFA
jgi:hypothetical protein